MNQTTIKLLVALLIMASICEPRSTSFKHSLSRTRRTVTGLRTKCIPYVKNFCQWFTVRGVTKLDLGYEGLSHLLPPPGYVAVFQIVRFSRFLDYLNGSISLDRFYYSGMNREVYIVPDQYRIHKARNFGKLKGPKIKGYCRYI